MAECDVFDEDADELTVDQRYWQLRQLELRKEGFREGRSEGEEKHLQQFFDVAYSAGYRDCKRIAIARGQLSAALALLRLTESSDSSVTSHRRQSLDERTQLVTSSLAALEHQLAKSQQAVLRPSNDVIDARLVEATQLLSRLDAEAGVICRVEDLLEKSVAPTAEEVSSPDR